MFKRNLRIFILKFKKKNDFINSLIFIELLKSKIE